MNPSKEALKDITKYLKEQEELKPNKHLYHEVDVYVVSQKWLRTKETTEFNRELGIYSINKVGNTNGY